MTEISGLERLPLRPEYRSGDETLARDFFEPCLSVSTTYMRAVGYFSSAGLAAAGRGLEALIDNGGRMLLVASPILDREDVAAIERGIRAQTDVLERALLKQLVVDAGSYAADRFGCMAWLLAEELLQIRLAVPVDIHGAVRNGIYHEKIGIFRDDIGNAVAFTGSPNETAGGLVVNFESLDVFWSWNDPQGRVSRKIAYFEELWAGRTQGLRVRDCPSAVRESLLQFRPVTRPSSSVSGHRLREPNGSSGFATGLWRHQREAVQSFLRIRRGVLEMATGTGKTRTALAICEALQRERKIETIIVSTDGTDLLDQWTKDLLKLGQNHGAPWGVYRQYDANREAEVFLLNPSGAILLVSRNFLARVLRAMSEATQAKTLLIHDEVHRLGSPGNVAALSGLMQSIPFRLGLSATPEREYDDEGNQFVETELGPIIYRYELPDAIRDGVLAPFNYVPLPYLPDEADREAVSRVYRQVAARNREGRPMSKGEIWTAIARVYKTSRAKLPVFAEFIVSRPELLNRCIIFVETTEYARDVLEIVHSLRPDFHTYFAGEDRHVLERFASGELECLVTCHRLSEGIDIRSLETVILFSSARAKLEIIQRMGRCLRVDPANPGKVANVIDFVRADQAAKDDDNMPTDLARREWLSKLSTVRG